MKKNDDMGGTCSTHGVDSKVYKNLVGKSEENIT
jgi:hypothetical protein